MVEVMRSSITKTPQDNSSNTKISSIANIFHMEKMDSPQKVRPLSREILPAKDFWFMEKSFCFKKKGAL